MPNRPLHVFLCYDKEDKPTVDKLYHQLAAEGWMDVWQEEVDLLPGQDREIEIPRAVQQADVVVVCLSTHSVDKEGDFHTELHLVLDAAKKKPEGTIFVIPLRLNACHVPHSLNHWQPEDYFPEGHQAVAYQRLVKSMKVRLAEAQRQGREKEEAEDQEKARLAAQNVEAERLAREKAEAERKAKDEQERLAEQKANAERVAREKVETERKAKDEREHLAEQKAKAERVAREKIEAERKAKEKRERKDTQEQKVNQPVRQEPRPALQSGKSRPQALMIGGGIVAVIALLCLLVGVYPLAKAWMVKSTPTPVASEVVPMSEEPEHPGTEEPEFGSALVSPIDHMTAFYVTGGSFMMGSDAKLDEMPVTSVNLESFWIDKTEVTNAMYAECVQAGQCALPGNTVHFNDPNYARHPVTYVAWIDAKHYCAYAGRRLPTEAEWEKAARGTDQRTYPWGNNAPNTNLLNYNKNIGDTKAVGSYPNGWSPYYALDMAGNVWEWVSSLYKGYPYQATDGREDLAASSAARVARGGSWKDTINFVRTTVRYGYSPSTSLGYLGFRCALSK